MNEGPGRDINKAYFLNGTTIVQLIYVLHKMTFYKDMGNIPVITYTLHYARLAQTVIMPPIASVPMSTVCR